MLPSEKWTMWQEGLLSAARSEQELKWKMAALVDARVSADVQCTCTCTRRPGQKRRLGKRKINADAKVRMHLGQQLWLSNSNENECKCKSGNVIATVDSNGKRLHWSTCGRTSICICAPGQNLRLG